MGASQTAIKHEMHDNRDASGQYVVQYLDEYGFGFTFSQIDAVLAVCVNAGMIPEIERLTCAIPILNGEREESTKITTWDHVADRAYLPSQYCGAAAGWSYLQYMHFEGSMWRQIAS